MNTRDKGEERREWRKEREVKGGGGHCLHLQVLILILSNPLMKERIDSSTRNQKDTPISQGLDSKEKVLFLVNLLYTADLQAGQYFVLIYC
jgi:hypothetical protein